MLSLRYDDECGHVAHVTLRDDDTYRVAVTTDGGTVVQYVDPPAFLTDALDSHAALVAAAKAGISFAIADEEASR